MQGVDGALHDAEHVFEVEIVVGLGPGHDFVQEADRRVFEVEDDFVHTPADAILLLRVDSDQLQHFRAWLVA